MQYKDTKLIAFLNTFSKSDLIEFEKFLISPYFRQSRDPAPLFNILKKFHPDYSSDRCNEENIFKELYPALNYSEKKSKDLFRTISSSLLKSIEEFIYFSELKENKIFRNRTILKRLLQKNLLKYYEQYLSIADSDLALDEINFGKDHLERFYLERLSTRYFSVALDFKTSIEHNLKAVELISAYSMLDLIRTAKTVFLDENQRNIKHENNKIDKLLEAVNMPDFLKTYEGTPHYIYLYFNYYTYKCLVTDMNKEFYQKAKSLFFENRTVLSRYDKNFFYADLINIVNTKVIKNEGTYRKESFLLLKLCLEDKAYKMSDNDFMQPDFYRNVIVITNFLREYDWADNFINEFTTELNPVYRENMMYYSMAYISFGRGDFESALEHITKVKYDLANFKVDVKILMLKIYYELKLYEQAISIVDAFKHYIKNAKNIRNKVKDSYSDFLKKFVMILKLNSNDKNSDAGLLKLKLIKKENHYEKSWLLEKLNEIENSKK